VPHPVSGLCTETSLTACNTKDKEFSDMSEEEDPLAVTSPAVKAEQMVINVYMGCNRRNGPDFGRVFLMLYYTDITQNTYIQS